MTLIGKNDLTIEAAPGATLTWRPPAKPGDFKQILYVANCENLAVHGVTFDGARKVDEGLLLLGNCAGLSLKGLQVRGFKKYGILLSNCVGEPGREASLQDVQITAVEDAEAGIAFIINEKVATPKVNEHIAIRDCRFEGNYKKPVLLGSKAAVPDNLIWENNTYKSKKDVTPNQLPSPK